jgi:hypothetical protein
MRRSLFQCLLFIPLFFVSGGLSAQQPAILVSSAPLRLREVTDHAGTIFVGRVISIEALPLASSSDQVGCVQITFQVEQGIRGARAGEQFSFREWGGLWSGADRYRVGQRMMLFLYTPGALGLTSPVGGGAGRLPVDASGRVRLSPTQQQSIQISQTRDVGSRRVPVREVVRAIRRMSEE